MARKAASYAALIREEFDEPVELEQGKLGQFEVRVDDRPVVSRRGGLIAKLMRKPWPSDEDVLNAVRAAL